MMKRLSVLALLAAALFAGGCGTSGAPSSADIDGALSVIAQGVSSGVVAWQQYQALQDAAQEAQASCETAPASDAPVSDPPSSVLLPPSSVLLPPSSLFSVAVLGNRATCSWCVKLWAQPLESTVEAALPGADVIDADKSAAPALYALYRPKTGFAYPLARVFGPDGRHRGDFSARGLTPAAFAAKVRALCPECAEAPRRGGIVSRDRIPAAAVVVGLTRVDPSRYGGWSGACPGCDVDAQAFAVACQSEGVPSELLLDAAATWPAVLDAVRRAAARLSPGGLLIAYVSGHGGQVASAEPSETDGRSETLCLYDGPLVDDKVWELLLAARARGVRVWMITDTCNSGSNYRAPHDYAAALRPRLAPGDPQLLHWGGCADGKSSFGTSQGGTFTTALVDTYKPGQTYAAWFAAIARRMPFNQRPTCEYTGPDFRFLPAFR